MRLLILSAFLAMALAYPACLVDEQLRNDCGYSGISQAQCESQGCCWGALSTGAYPWCFYPDTRNCGQYYLTAFQDLGNGGSLLTLEIASQGCAFYGEDVATLSIYVFQETDTILHVKIVDPQRQRWEVPEEIIPRKHRTSQSQPNALYRFGYTANPFGFYVVRTDSGEVIFNTTADSGAGALFRNLIFEDQFLELSTHLPVGANIYGVGERKVSFRLPAGNQLPIWTADELTPYLENNYGSHPFYIEHRNGRSHGVFLLNCNGMDVDLASNFLRYRLIGGIFDFYFLMGPTPDSVVSQYLSIVGRPYLVPYWALGWHQCKWGYNNLNEVKEVVRRYRESNIPLETMWTDIDYMDGYRCWTFDPVNYPVAEVREFVAELHASHQKYVLIVDPGIKNETGYYYFDIGKDMQVYLKGADGQDFVGRVWPGNTVFVDFLSPNAYDYWKLSINDFLQMVAVDGLWVDMNEVANFCNGYCDDDEEEEIQRQKELLEKQRSREMNPQKKTYEPNYKKFDPNNPPYKINNRLEWQPLKFKTTEMDVSHYGGYLEYDAHNLYGASEVIATKNALEEITNQRAFVLSRSTFSGSGHHGGHWSGDNYADWENLYYSIPAMLNLNMFGIPYIGADICGFAGDTTEELCGRWMQLGAFYPFARNHNMDGQIPQEPYLWDSVASISRDVLGIRYSMLPLYYTLFYEASAFGSMVIRPLFFEFPADTNTYAIDTQFLIGSAVLITPVLTQGASSVTGYFPAARWYDYYTHKGFISQGERVTLDAPFETIPIHYLGGHVVALHSPRYTTYETQQTDFSLIVALDTYGVARGTLYLDDGISLGLTDNQTTYITFVAQSSQSSGALTANGRYHYSVSNRVSDITILGVISTNIQLVTLNGNPVAFEFDASLSKLVVRNLSQSIVSPLTLNWS